MAQDINVGPDKFWGQDSVYYIIYRTNDLMFEETFYKNGVKRSFRSELNGKMNGINTEYYENGNVKFIEGYLNDIEVGTWVYYYPDGKIRQRSNFDFKKDDIFLIYSFDTIVVLDSSFGGREHFDTIISNTGYKKPLVTIEYFPNGNIKFEAHYCNRMRTGVWKFYNEVGVLLKEEVYKENVLISKKEY
jgi:antitoxin component YwqK of YwqJK toxin-antitoxin module